MASDIKLTDTDDVTYVNNDFVLVTDGTEVAQAVKIRVRTILAEWVFDYTLGLDWWGDMTSFKTSIDQKKNLMRSEVLATPGVRAVRNFEIGIDPETFKIEAEFVVETIYGSIEQVEVTS